MANGMSICGDDAIYVPPHGTCDECDRLAQEFEEARQEAVASAKDAKTYAEQAEESATEAGESATSAKESADNAKVTLADTEAILEQVQSVQGQRFEQDYTTSGGSISVLTFNPSGYTYNETDRYSVYVNGLRLNENEYSRNKNIITLANPITETGQVISMVVDTSVDVECVQADNELYGARWDRTTNMMERLYSASDITTDTTNFAHHGTFNTDLDNPFDAIYPWSDMVVCNVDLEAYRRRTGTESLKNFIVATYGDPDFTYEGTKDLFVGRYRPEFWFNSFEDSLGRVTYLVSPTERTGYKHSPECIDGISFAVDAGTNASGQAVVTAGSGIPLSNIAVSQIHARAKNSGFTIQNIDSIDAIITLYVVEYANMNIQQAIGDGCSNEYRENADDRIEEVQVVEGKSAFVVRGALAPFMWLGTQLDFGTTTGATTYKGVVANLAFEATSPDSWSAVHVILDRELPLDNGMHVSVHGFDACEFPITKKSVGNGSGYINTHPDKSYNPNGKTNAWYRGAVLYANRYSYMLGIYKEQNTNHIWVCPDGVDPDDYDALNTSVHLDTGVALPAVDAGKWLTMGSTAQRVPTLEAFMVTGESSGSSVSPIGDQQYVLVPSTSNTILFFGGNASTGWICGAFCGSWNNTSGRSWWSYSALPLLRREL